MYIVIKLKTAYINELENSHSTGRNCWEYIVFLFFLSFFIIKANDMPDISIDELSGFRLIHENKRFFPIYIGFFSSLIFF